MKYRYQKSQLFWKEKRQGKFNLYTCEIATNSVNLHSEKIKSESLLGPIAQLVRAPDS